MPTFDDLLAGEGGSSTAGNRNGSAGALSPASNKLPALGSRPKRTIIDPSIDQAWGGTGISFTTPGTNPYYQYFYSGQDIIVSIDGTESDIDYKTLPIVNLGWSVIQSKLLLYGFWSYTPDAVARGARQVSGSFTLVSKSPNYMKSLLSVVAKARINQTTQYSNTSVSQDDQNILAFWGGNAQATLQSGSSVNLYQAHPPFDLVLVYGVQDISLNNMDNVVTAHHNQTPWYTDTNERLVESDNVNQSNRYVLKSCEILGMSTQYTTSGDIIQETYNFVANDVINPDS